MSPGPGTGEPRAPLLRAARRARQLLRKRKNTRRPKSAERGSGGRGESGDGFFPRELKAIGVLTSNKEGKVIFEIDGWVLGGMQFEFGVLV